MLTALPGTDGLWQAQAPLVLPGGATLPMRMTVLRLPDGGLWLHSVIPLDDALARSIEALGTVRHIVAPSLFHHLHVRGAAERWPEAQIWGAPGLAAKRPRLRMNHVLPGGQPEAWGGALTALPLGGAPRLGEVVFFHAPTGTLICSDLVFHMRTWQGRATGLVLRLMGTRGRLAGSRALHIVVRDRAAFSASLATVRQWPFRRILMGHGEPYESDRASEDLLDALALRLGARWRAAFAAQR